MRDTPMTRRRGARVLPCVYAARVPNGRRRSGRCASRLRRRGSATAARRWGLLLARGVLAGLLVAVGAVPASAARLKDIAFIEGVRTNQLWGYGLVVGLDGSGDSQQALFTPQSVLNLLRRRGLTLNVNPRQLQLKNVAAVVVTADLPPFARSGSRLDVVVSSLGDAESLQGGTLLQTPLFGGDQEVYAVAQGPVSLGGGFLATGTAASTTKGHPTTGYISGGAIVEREVPTAIARRGVVTVSLQDPDFTTASRVAAAINAHVRRDAALPRDAGTVQVVLADPSPEAAVRLATAIEALEVEPDQRARVVLNERTGTVIMGDAVRVMPVAIAHGTLTVRVKTDFGVSQPAPFAERGRTVVVPDTSIGVEEGAPASLSVLRPGVSLGELVAALNALGVTPQDLIAILEAIRAAGALQAELEIM